MHQLLKITVIIRPMYTKYQNSHSWLSPTAPLPMISPITWLSLFCVKVLSKLKYSLQLYVLLLEMVNDEKSLPSPRVSMTVFPRSKYDQESRKRSDHECLGVSWNGNDSLEKTGEPTIPFSNIVERTTRAFKIGTATVKQVCREKSAAFKAGQSSVLTPGNERKHDKFTKVCAEQGFKRMCSKSISTSITHVMNTSHWIKCWYQWQMQDHLEVEKLLFLYSSIIWIKWQKSFDGKGKTSLLANAVI